jgi:hypothetical protein
MLSYNRVSPYGTLKILYTKEMKIPNLSADEVAFIQSLDKSAAHSRLRSLWEAGWSLQSLGESLNPPRPKTTVHFWVRNASATEQQRPVPVPPPRSFTVSTPVSTAPRLRTISPGVPSHMKDQLRQLSDQAKRYRAKTPSSHPVAVANEQLTVMVKTLYTMGVPTRAIADAAGVTYRAMARRIAK